MTFADHLKHVIGPFAALGAFIGVVLMIAVACGA